MQTAADAIAELFLRENAGHPAYRGDADFHRLRIGWEYASGQWVGLVGLDGAMHGWASYYRVTDRILELIREWRIEEIVRGGAASRDLTHGPHIYVATTVVVARAPRSTYMDLYRLARAKNPHAVSIAAHLRKRNGMVRWMHRALTPGQPWTSSRRIHTVYH